MIYICPLFFQGAIRCFRVGLTRKHLFTPCKAGPEPEPGKKGDKGQYSCLEDAGYCIEKKLAGANRAQTVMRLEEKR